MLFQLVNRVLRTTDKRLIWKFAWNFGAKSALSMMAFKRGIRRGNVSPIFLYLSITNSCNLRCKGCWVDVEAPREQIDADLLNRVIGDAKQHGIHFFGILGGEPFMHPQLMEVLAAHPDCYFQIMTNGQLITETVAAELNRLGNVTPLVSIEGLEQASEDRRRGRDVFNRSMRGLENCIKARLLTGVATSLCRTNIDDLLSETWLQRLIDIGAHYVWYYAYRPVGPEMCPDLALTAEQQVRSRRFIVEMRRKMPIGIVDAFTDHLGRALCPTAVGFSHHVNWRGEIEPCPVIQFAKENIRDGASVMETIRNSEFLRDFRKTAAQSTRGCIVLEKPEVLRELVLRHGARDTTNRQTAMKELEAMKPHYSQWIPGLEVPEQHWMYYWAKKMGFNDFGIYDQVKHDVEAKKRAVNESLSRSDLK